MCDIVPTNLLSISSPVAASSGSYDNILDWTSDNLLFSASEMQNPYFVVSSKKPIRICYVKFMSNPKDYAYPKEWTLTGIDDKGKSMTLLKDKPGLCDGNSKSDSNGELCNSNTISYYDINYKLKLKSLTFTQIKRSHLNGVCMQIVGSIKSINLCTRSYRTASNVYFFVLIANS